MTKEDLEHIEKLCRLRELPDGWFYNGTYFVSLDGEKRNTHPNLEQFIEAHLRQANERIEAANRSHKRVDPLDFEKVVRVEFS